MLQLYELPLFRIRPLYSAVECSKRPFSIKSCEPLRILFCGSDKFSIASLQALDRERRVKPELVASIDVVCRPEKPVQRNLKALREGLASPACFAASY